MIKIISVVGARPNFMKIAPFIRAIESHNKKKDEVDDTRIEHLLVHTGQHYDLQMSYLFFKQLDIPRADINLGVGSGTHAQQVGKTMIAFEKVLKRHRPDWIVIVGDVNATLACSITAKKEHIKCCHIEAGIRSGDITMPEEVNRIVADRLSDLLLTPHRVANENLKKEGVPDNKICFVGNTMIDTLDFNLQKAQKLDMHQIIIKNQLKSGFSFFERKSFIFDLEFKKKDFVLITLHRPSNVDSYDILNRLVSFIVDEAARDSQIIWPLHPRTKMRLKSFNLWKKVCSCRNLFLTCPLGYLEMLRLNMNAKVMLTDSGSLQAECAVLGVPCLILRWNTEWPMTLKECGGANALVGNDINLIRPAYQEALKKPRTPQNMELWDGNAAVRCLEAIVNYK